MEITPVSTSRASFTPASALRPAQEADRPQLRANSAASERMNGNDTTIEQQPPPQPPTPTINGTGQTIGTRINVTA